MKETLNPNFDKRSSHWYLLVKAQLVYLLGMVLNRAKESTSLSQGAAKSSEENKEGVRRVCVCHMRSRTHTLTVDSTEQTIGIYISQSI